MTSNQHSLRGFRALVLGENTFKETYYKDIETSLEVEIVNVFDQGELLELLEQDSDFDLLFARPTAGDSSLDDIVTELFQQGYGYIPVCLIHGAKDQDTVEDCRAVGVKDFIESDGGIDAIKNMIEKHFKFKDEDVG